MAASTCGAWLFLPWRRWRLFPIWRPHPNCLRVHVLVGLSACLLLLAAGPGPDARSRAIQGVATGVGFLGAGEIMTPPPSQGNAPYEVRGLSSAASIWFTAALGITVAASSPVLALIALGLALVTLSPHPFTAMGRLSEGSGESTSPAKGRTRPDQNR